MSDPTNTYECSRCGRRCQLKPQRTDDARLLRAATEITARGGWCADCAMTAFIRHGDGLGLIFRNEPDPSIFRARHVQEAVERLLVVGKADAAATELNWDTIIDNWDLPFGKMPTALKQRRRR